MKTQLDEAVDAHIEALAEVARLESEVHKLKTLLEKIYIKLDLLDGGYIRQGDLSELMNEIDGV